MLKKKSCDVLREGIAVRYGCIEQLRGEFPVALILPRAAGDALGLLRVARARA